MLLSDKITVWDILFLKQRGDPIRAQTHDPRVERQTTLQLGHCYPKIPAFIYLFLIFNIEIFNPY
jgi:hypothetical protein